MSLANSGKTRRIAASIATASSDADFLIAARITIASLKQILYLVSPDTRAPLLHRPTPKPHFSKLTRNTFFSSPTRRQLRASPPCALLSIPRHFSRNAQSLPVLGNTVQQNSLIVSHLLTDAELSTNISLVLLPETQPHLPSTIQPQYSQRWSILLALRGRKSKDYSNLDVPPETLSTPMSHRTNQNYLQPVSIPTTDNPLIRCH